MAAAKTASLAIVALWLLVVLCFVVSFGEKERGRGGANEPRPAFLGVVVGPSLCSACVAHTHPPPQQWHGDAQVLRMRLQVPSSGARAPLSRAHGVGEAGRTKEGGLNDG